MIELLTLLSGFLLGPIPIELHAAPRVASIEILLDGEVADRLERAPWTTDIDLGPDLAPHLLELVAYDDTGKTLESRRHWINYRAPASHDRRTPIAVHLERDSAGRLAELPTPDLTGWLEVDGKHPHTELRDSSEMEIVVVQDPKAQGFFDRLAEHAVLTDYTIYTGLQRDQIPVFLEQIHDIRGYAEPFLAGSPEPFAGALRPPSPEQQRQMEASFRTRQAWPEGAQIWHLSPEAAPVSRISRSTSVFNISRPLVTTNGGWLWQSEQIPPMVRFSLRLADAAAVAGLEASASGKRRAVLVITAGTPDESALEPAQVEAFLRRLGVPLFVWCFEGSGERWSRARQIEHRGPSFERLVTAVGPDGDTHDPLRPAFDALRDTLDRQRILLVEGAVIPGRIKLTPQARGLQLENTP